MQCALSAPPAASGATIDNAYASLWNPHSTVRLEVYQVTWNTRAGAVTPAWGLKRTTARGTATAEASAITADHEKGIAPPSGAAIDHTYTGQPTLDGGYLYRIKPGDAGRPTACLYFDPSIEVPPAAGLALVTTIAVAVPIGDIGFFWNE